MEQNLSKQLRSNADSVLKHASDVCCLAVRILCCVGCSNSAISCEKPYRGSKKWIRGHNVQGQGHKKIRGQDQEEQTFQGKIF